MELVNIKINESEISSLSKTYLKKHVKGCVANATFKSLKLIQSEHDKVKHITYKTFKTQSYLTSDLFNIKNHQYCSTCMQTQ